MNLIMILLMHIFDLRFCWCVHLVEFYKGMYLVKVFLGYEFG